MSCTSAAANASSSPSLQRAIVAALEPDRRDRVGRQAAAADGARVVRGVEREVVGQRRQPPERAVEGARQLVDAVLAVGVEVRSAGVADEQGVAGEHEPGLVAAGVGR